MTDFKAVRVDQYWQRACVYYIRLDEFVREFEIGVEHELDSGDHSEAKYILVFDHQGTPVGTCRLNVLDDNHGKIERVSVLKQYRHQGVGRVVITEAEKWFKELGIHHISINSRDNSVGFYEKLGYHDCFVTDLGCRIN